MDLDGAMYDRRVRRTALLVALGVLFGTWVPAAHGQVPNGDSVVGRGQTFPLPPQSLQHSFDLEARSGPSGEDPSGYVTVEIGYPLSSGVSLHTEGPVRCLNVSGNRAVVGFELDPDLSNFPSVGAFVQAEDDGPPGSGDFLIAGPTDDPTVCP